MLYFIASHIVLTFGFLTFLGLCLVCVMGLVGSIVGFIKENKEKKIERSRVIRDFTDHSE